MLPSPLLENAVTQMSMLPGIGRRTALRLVLHLLRRRPDEVHALSHALRQLADDVRYCTDCNNISEGARCAICCAADRRVSTQICVVEEIHDLLAIENTGHYRGLYHVLGGLIAPLRGSGPEALAIEPLRRRIEIHPDGVHEIIFALSATIEGDTTAHYVSQQLTGLGLRFSTLARGIPQGSELEYTDALTLGRSLNDRRPHALPPSPSPDATASETIP